MGLIAFCGFVLPWIAVAVWLYTTQIKPYHTGVPWRTIARYPGPGEGPPEGRPHEARILGEVVPPLATVTMPGERDGARDGRSLH